MNLMTASSRDKKRMVELIHRRDYLALQIANGKYTYSDYAKSELKALDWAIENLSFFMKIDISDLDSRLERREKLNSQ